MHSALTTLRDIEGVVGSFVIDGDGHVLGRDIPAMFDDATLGYAAERLARLRDALEGERSTLEGGVARFGSHLLVMKAAADRTLCVIVPQGTNLMSLQMGANIVARRVAQLPPEPERAEVHVASIATSVAPEPPSVSAPTPPAAAAAPPAATKPTTAGRMFRGRRIG